MWMLLLCCGCGSSPPPVEPDTERDIAGEASVEIERVPVPAEDEPAGTPASPRVARGDPSGFARDQPHIVEMQRWNGGLVVQADAFYAIDLGAATASRLAPPDVEAVLAVATMGTTPVALCKRADGRVLLAREGEAWAPRTLPDELRTGQTAVTMAANDGGLVVLAPGKLHRLRGTTWTAVTVAAPPREMRGDAAHVLLAGDLLYLGWDAGEWGGAVLVLDTRNGRWTVGPDPGTPAHDIELDRDGKVWVATGLAHLGGLRGALFRQDDGAWTRVAATSNARDAQIVSWSLPPDSFQSVAFDAEGRPNVLTGTLGIVRQIAAGTFHQRTRSWPASRYLYVKALTFEGGTAVIASDDAGVWLWNLATDEIRRVALR